MLPINNITAALEGIVLGIDPGSHKTGYAILKCEKGGPITYIQCGILEAKHDASIGDRLLEIGLELSEIIEEFSPSHAVIEDIFSHKLHPKSALILGQARGALLYELKRHKIRISTIAPTQVKRTITGKGRAQKQLVRQMVMKLAGLHKPPPIDASDALAMAYTLAITGENINDII